MRNLGMLFRQKNMASLLTAAPVSLKEKTSRKLRRKKGGSKRSHTTGKVCNTLSPLFSRSMNSLFGRGGGCRDFPVLDHKMFFEFISHFRPGPTLKILLGFFLFPPKITKNLFFLVSYVPIV